MSQIQTQDNCRYFNNRNRCPNIKDELMLQFIKDTRPLNGIAKQMDFSKAEIINNKFCNSCNTFIDKFAKE